MEKQILKYIIGHFILFLTLGLNAQSTEMKMNNNRIDKDFDYNFEIKAKLNGQNKTENEIILIVEKSTDSLYSIYVFNNTIDSLNISIQDWSLYLIQEAKNLNGEWKPIEFWQYSWCGNSYLSDKLEPKGILKSESFAYQGNIETQIRFKLLNNNKVYYSNSIKGLVDLTQFQIPENITDNRVYKGILRIGKDFELLKKILFLEPNGMKEYSEIYKADLNKINKNRKN